MRHVTILALLFASLPALALEELNELEARTSRRSTNTLYTGETGSSYSWQPQTVMYVDTTTGAEVWRITNMENGECASHSEEYGYPSAWSADGKRLAIAICTNNNSAYTPPTYTWSNAPWFTMRSDYTKFRIAEDNMTRRRRHRTVFGWSPVEPDVAYQIGAASAGEDTDHGVSQRYLYKATVGDDSISLTQWIDMGDTTDRYIDKTITPDGQKAIVYDWSPYNRSNPRAVTLLPAGSRGIDASWTFDSPERGWDDHWGDTDETSPPVDLHNARVVGNAAEGYWFYLRQSTSYTWWRTRLTGSGADGGPQHIADTVAPYSWWPDGELQPTGDLAHGTDNSPWCDDGDPATDCPPYPTHPYHYADGQIALIGESPPDVYDFTNRVYVENGIGTHTGTQHPNWNAWSDYAAVWPMNAETTPIWIVHPWKDSSTVIVYPHHNESGDDEGVSQSPDGTKVTYGSSWLQSGSGPENQDKFVVVAYGPYPPEITGATATGGTVRVTVGWELDANTRGYASRGWPDPDSDDPPPPREIKLFRLWRCGNNSGAPDGNWTPLATVSHDIFSRYNFANGVWSGSSSWTLTDAPGNGTHHYAVTSQEHSGLESRTLRTCSPSRSQTVPAPAPSRFPTPPIRVEVPISTRRRRNDPPA